MIAEPPTERSPGLAPRAWLIWSLAAVTVALSTDNPVYRGLVALVTRTSADYQMVDGQVTRARKPAFWARASGLRTTARCERARS